MRYNICVVATVLTIASVLSGCTIGASTDTASNKSKNSAKHSVKPQENRSNPVVPPKPGPTEDTVHKNGKNANVLTILDELNVKGRAPKTGYSRDLFGYAWKDMDRNGCDTRNDILKRDLINVIYDKGSDCVIVTGTLNDPYGGSTIGFVRGQTTSTAVQIDHLVALSDAWQKGAQQWSVEKRETFANDPLNLVAADGPLNMQKSDGDAATWLPPNRKYWCDYVVGQIAVKRAYSLSVTSAEKSVMRGIVEQCPQEKILSSQMWTTP